MSALVNEHRSSLPFQPLSTKRIPLMVPKQLSLKENYQETVALVHAVRSYALDSFLPVDLYFDEVEQVEPAALIVLAAEIHRCRNLRRSGGRPLVHGTYPRDPVVCAQLNRMGFFKLLRLADDEKPEAQSADPHVVMLPFLTDLEIKTGRLETFIEALTTIMTDVVTMDARSQRYLYGAIIEAMKNAGEHGYKVKPPHQPMGHRWWLSAGLDVRHKEVSILLFDQGAGIPATLEPDLWKVAESIWKGEGVQPPDSLLIEMATRRGETSTNQAGRGQGFKTMRKFVDACDDGDLLVYSNFGLYEYKRASTSRTDAAASLGGTLIQWRFRHSAPLVGISL